MTDLGKGAAWVKGRVVPIDQASIGVTDWGFTHSDATYDVAAVWEGAFFKLDAHLDRFEASMAELRLDVGMDRAAIKAALTEMAAASGLRRAYCAMVASRGWPMIPGSRDPRDCANHFIGWIAPFVYVVPEAVAEAGATLWIAKTARRIPDDSVNPRVKNYHWGDFTRGLFEAKDEGFDTAALLDHAGNVTEGPGFNVFAVSGDRLVTSDHGALHGVTRATVMEIACAEGLAVEARPLPLDELMEADEVFLATTGGGVTPVRRVDGRVFSNDAPGPVTMRLRAAYHAERMKPEHRTPIPFPGEADGLSHGHG